MRLSDNSLGLLTLHIRNKLALELKCSVPSVDRWIKSNKENGKLTTAQALSIISEETGLRFEEILEANIESTMIEH